MNESLLSPEPLPGVKMASVVPLPTLLRTAPVFNTAVAHVMPGTTELLSHSRFRGTATKATSATIPPERQIEVGIGDDNGQLDFLELLGTRIVALPAVTKLETAPLGTVTNLPPRSKLEREEQ